MSLTLRRTCHGAHIPVQVVSSDLPGGGPHVPCRGCPAAYCLHVAPAVLSTCTSRSPSPAASAAHRLPPSCPRSHWLLSHRRALLLARWKCECPFTLPDSFLASYRNSCPGSLTHGQVSHIFIPKMRCRRPQRTRGQGGRTNAELQRARHGRHHHARHLQDKICPPFRLC